MQTPIFISVALPTSTRSLCLPPWRRLHHWRHRLRHRLRRRLRRLWRRGHNGGRAAQGRLETVVALEIIQKVVQMTQASANGRVSLGVCTDWHCLTFNLNIRIVLFGIISLHSKIIFNCPHWRVLTARANRVFWGRHPLQEKKGRCSRTKQTAKCCKNCQHIECYSKGLLAKGTSNMKKKKKNKVGIVFYRAGMWELEYDDVWVFLIIENRMTIWRPGFHQFFFSWDECEPTIGRIWEVRIDWPKGSRMLKAIDSTSSTHGYGTIVPLIWYIVILKEEWWVVGQTLDHDIFTIY